MEHIIVKQRADGYVQLIPAQGYLLYNNDNGRTFSEAIVKPENAARFSAVQVEPVDPDAEISDAEALDIIVNGNE